MGFQGFPPPNLLLAVAPLQTSSPFFSTSGHQAHVGLVPKAWGGESTGPMGVQCGWGPDAVSYHDHVKSWDVYFKPVSTVESSCFFFVWIADAAGTGDHYCLRDPCHHDTRQTTPASTCCQLQDWQWLGMSQRFSTVVAFLKERLLIVVLQPPNSNEYGKI